jgi:hypothetical protein
MTWLNGKSPALPFVDGLAPVDEAHARAGRSSRCMLRGHPPVGPTPRNDALNEQPAHNGCGWLPIPFCSFQSINRPVAFQRSVRQACKIIPRAHRKIQSFDLGLAVQFRVEIRPLLGSGLVDQHLDPIGLSIRVVPDARDLPGHPTSW